MIWVVFVSVHFVLSYSTVPGQCKVFSYAISVSGSEESNQVSLHEQDHRLETLNQNMRSAFEKLEAAVNRTDIRGQAVSESLSSALQAVNMSLDKKLQVMQKQLFSLINDGVVAVLRDPNQKFQALNEATLPAIDKSDEKLNATFDGVKESNQSVESQDHCRNTSVVCDCSDIKANGYRTSGVYRIYVVDQGQRYYANASCDMTTTNDGWTVFQRRKDGSIEFDRDWNDYEYGFGNPNGEFWLGNSFLHLLTSKRRYRLRIDLEDFEEENRYAEYSTFNISSSVDKYRLRIGTYSGTAGDALSAYSDGGRFSTKDSDNDPWSSGSCAVERRGGWWFNDDSVYCSTSNLNGLYLRGKYSKYRYSSNGSNRSFHGAEGILWLPWRYFWYSLKTTEIKIASS